MHRYRRQFKCVCEHAVEQGGIEGKRIRRHLVYGDKSTPARVLVSELVPESCFLLCSLQGAWGIDGSSTISSMTLEIDS
jgi:hypothetical protein